MEDLYMEKLIALFEGSDEAFDTIILVKNYDEGFKEALKTADSEWQTADVEFYDLLCRRAKEAGYDVCLPDFEKMFC